MTVGHIWTVGQLIGHRHKAKPPSVGRSWTREMSRNGGVASATTDEQRKRSTDCMSLSGQTLDRDSDLKNKRITGIPHRRHEVHES